MTGSPITFSLTREFVFERLDSYLATLHKLKVEMDNVGKSLTIIPELIRSAEASQIILQDIFDGLD